MSDLNDFFAWATKERKAIVLKGDVPGHEFHGNQWTGGGGEDDSGSGGSSGGDGVTVTTGATYNGEKKYEPSKETKQRILGEYDKATKNFEDRLGISRGSEFISHPDTMGSVEKFATKLNIQEVPNGEDDRLVGGRHISNRTTFADRVIDGKSIFEKHFERDRDSILNGKEPYFSTGSISGLLSHELSHGIEDGLGFSQRAEWSRAYKKALSNNTLPSKYSKINEHEGFAEVLARYVETGYSDEVTDTAVSLAKKVFHNR